MIVSSNKSVDVSRLRETVQALYRHLGLLQRDQICCDGVTVPQCYALQILRREGELLPGELAERMGIEPSSATRAVDVLVRDGYVKRMRPETGDRRRVIIRLTRRGEEMTDRLIEAGDAFYERILSAFPKEERANVVGTLVRLADAIGMTEGCCDPFRVAKTPED